MASKISTNDRKNRVEPYHLFTVLGEYFLFDTASYQFYRIDELTYELLSLCRKYPIDLAKSELLTREIFSKEEIDEVSKEVSLLFENGLLISPGNYLSKEQIDNFDNALNISEKPSGIELCLTEGCNLACTYCYCSKNQAVEHNAMMTKETAKKAIDIIMDSVKESVVILLIGGEPLLNRVVIDFVMEYSQEQAKLKNKKVHYSMTTNATLLDDKMVEYIIKYQFGLMISLDGYKELHDAQCPTKDGRGSFDTVLQGVEKVMAARGYLTVRSTMISPMPRLESLIDFFEKTGFKKIVIGPATNMADSCDDVDFDENDFAELGRQQELLLPQMLDLLKQNKFPKYFPYEYHFSDILKGTLGAHYTRCGACGSVTCSTSGEFFPCHRFIGLNKWKIGSLESGISIELCKSFWRRYNECISEYCGLCWAYPICKGPCPWSLAQKDGSFRFNSIQCNFSKRFAEQAVYLFFWTQDNMDKKRLAAFNRKVAESIEQGE